MWLYIVFSRPGFSLRLSYLKLSNYLLFLLLLIIERSGEFAFIFENRIQIRMLAFGKNVSNRSTVPCLSHVFSGVERPLRLPSIQHETFVATTVMFRNLSSMPVALKRRTLVAIHFGLFNSNLHISKTTSVTVISP